MILLPESDVKMLRGIADALDPPLPDRCINPTSSVIVMCDDYTVVHYDSWRGRDGEGGNEKRRGKKKV